MPAIDKILDILHNGDWHRLTEVAEKTGTQESKMELISKFLSTYDFLEYDRKAKRMKLSVELQDFLERIRQVELEETERGNNRLS